MKKAKKISLIVAGALIGSGFIFVLIASIMIGFDFSRLDNTSYTERTFVLDKEFDNIYINSISDDIVFKRTNDKSGKVVVFESDDKTYTTKVENDTLNVTAHQKEKWINFNFDFFWNNKSHTITIYLPDNEYQKLSVETVSGDVKLAEISFSETEIQTISGDISLTVANDRTKLHTTSGEISLTGNTAGNTEISTVSGDVTLNSFTADTLNIGTTSGDVHLENTDARSIDINTVSGDVTGDLIGEKDIRTSTTSGDVLVHNSVRGKDPCNITTVSGDIILN